MTRAICLLLVLVFGQVLATPPLTPWHELENRALSEDIDTIRSEYQARIDRLLESLEAKSPGDTAEFWNKFMVVGQLMEYAHSWAGVEGRTDPDKVREKSFGRIVEVSRQALAGLDDLKTVAPGIAAAQSDTERSRYGPVVQNIGSQDGNRDLLSLRVASLAMVLGGGELLDRAFDVFGDGVPSDTRTYRSASEFAEDPPDLDRALGILPEPVEPVVVPDDTEAVSETEKANARAVIEDVLTAAVAGDEASLGASYVDSELARSHARAMAESPVRLVKFDLSDARFQYQRTGEDEISVTVSDIKMTLEKDEIQEVANGRQVFLIDLSSGQALVRGKGQ